MPRKPVAPTISDKPADRTTSERSRDPKVPPALSQEQFDLWGAFAASWEEGEAVEAAPPRQAKTRGRRSPPMA